MTDLRSVTVLVPGNLHRHSIDRIGETFRMIRLDRVDASLITDEMKASVRGVAASPSLGDASIGPDFMRALPKLEIVANFGVGYDGVDAGYAGRNGIMVTNTPDVLTEEVADVAIGLLINTARELPKAEARLRSGNWAAKGNYPLTRRTLRGAASASSAWGASAWPSPAGWRLSACRSPTTTGVRWRAFPIRIIRRSRASRKRSTR